MLCVKPCFRHTCVCIQTHLCWANVQNVFLTVDTGLKSWANAGRGNAEARRCRRQAAHGDSQTLSAAHQGWVQPALDPGPLAHPAAAFRHPCAPASCVFCRRVWLAQRVGGALLKGRPECPGVHAKGWPSPGWGPEGKFQHPHPLRGTILKLVSAVSKKVSAQTEKGKPRLGETKQGTEAPDS